MAARLQSLRHFVGALGAFVLDAGLAIASYLMAYVVRFDRLALTQFMPGALRSLPLVVGCQLTAFLLLGLYSTTRRALWPTVLKAVSAGTAAGALATWLVIGFAGVSRASFVINALLLAVSVFSWRAVRIVWPLVQRSQQAIAHPVMEDRADRVSRAAYGLFGLFRYRQLLRRLILTELKLKYRRSVLGFVWSLLNPLLMVLVYTMTFTYILRVNDSAFVFRVLVGLLAWGFFTNSAIMASDAIMESRGLIKSIFFPRTILPVARVLFNLTQFLLNVVVFVPVMLLLFQVIPGASIWAFPVVLLLQVAFTIGLALTLSAATTFFRDIRHLLEVGLSALFWTTPIIFSYRQVPESLRTAVLLSPMSPFVVAYQEIFVYREWPDGAIWLLALMYAAVALMSGFVLFATYEDRFAEQV